MLSKLSKLGINVDSNEVLKKAKGKLPCAELIAEVLLSNKKNLTNKKLQPYFPNGKRSDMPYINFYHDFFAQGRPAYVKIEYMSLEDAIDLVQGNGEIPIIAHPGINLKNNLELIDDILNEGVMGIEVFSSYHSQSQINYFANKVTEKKVLTTCGSDFHGKNKPSIKLGDFDCNDNEDKIIKELKNAKELL